MNNKPGAPADKKKAGGSKRPSSTVKRASSGVKASTKKTPAGTKKKTTKKKVVKKAAAKKNGTKKAPASAKPAAASKASRASASKTKTAKTSKATGASKAAGATKASASKTPRKPAARPAAKKPSGVKTAAQKSAAHTPATAPKRAPSPSEPPAPVRVNGASTGEAPRLTDEQLRKVKTGLSRKHLAKFRDLLLERRGEIVGDMGTMQSTRGSTGELSHMPQHMADVGSDNYEQEFTLGLMESERRIVVEIDNALERIREGTYGVCLESGKPIPHARLEVQPWARYCIEVTRDRERRGLT